MNLCAFLIKQGFEDFPSMSEKKVIAFFNLSFGSNSGSTAHCLFFKMVSVSKVDSNRHNHFMQPFAW